jgi:hypothetical protein
MYTARFSLVSVMAALFLIHPQHPLYAQASQLLLLKRLMFRICFVVYARPANIWQDLHLSLALVSPSFTFEAHVLSSGAP